MTDEPQRQPPAASASPDRAAWPLLVSTATLYAAFGLIYGVMQGGLPPLLRSRGIDLAGIGWSFIVLVPFGLTFLWAPLIDAVHPWPSAPRIGWIVPLQAVIVGLLSVVAQGEMWPPVLLLGLGLLVAFAAATMDVALDALSTACVPIRQRGAAGGLKVAALALGSILGGGVFVASAGRIGWTATFQICAAVSALATIPILLNRSWDRDAGRPERSRPDILAILRRPETRRRMLLLTLTTCAMVALSVFNRVMLVDLGVPVATIGAIVGTIAPILGLLASITAIPMTGRIDGRAGIVVFGGLCLVATGTMLIGIQTHSGAVAMIGATMMNAGTSGTFAILSATTLGWARGDQPATDYAVLYGVSRLVATVLLIALANLVAQIGWSVFYVGAGLVLVIAILLLRPALPDLRAEDDRVPEQVRGSSGVTTARNRGVGVDPS